MSPDLADVLRAEIVRSGRSAKQIAIASGIPQTTLSHFLRGHDMSINRCSKVAKELGLKLTRSKAK